LRLLQVMHPVFDLPFCTFDATSTVCIGCLRGRPRGLFGRVSVVVDSSVSTPFIDSAICRSSIRTSLSSILGSRRLSKSSSSSPEPSIADSSSTNPDVVQGSVESDLTVRKVNVEDEEASERCRTARTSWRDMKRELEVTTNSGFVSRFSESSSLHRRSQYAIA
jgi:hypothetical protein